MHASMHSFLSFFFLFFVSPSEAKLIASQMLNHRFVTPGRFSESQAKETHPKENMGKPCQKIYIAERPFLRRETYFSITLDPTTNPYGPIIIASKKGGTAMMNGNIQKITDETPELVFTLPVDMDVGLKRSDAEDLAKSLGFNGYGVFAAADVFMELYQMFIEKDATLVEINPLGETIMGDSEYLVELFLNVSSLTKFLLSESLIT
jgi:succinyl-CoA synthetase beta subunit